MKSILRLLTCMGAALGLTFAASQAQATAVDLELVLAIDVSTSVVATEFDLQKTGYVNAFNNPAIATAISEGAIGAIAVSLVYWASNQVQAVGWTLIDGNMGTEASDFAAAIAATSRPSSASIGCCTGIAGGITFSDGLFAGNGYEGTRTAIDVSGDGEENITNDAGLDAARIAALASNTDTINGIAIVTSDYPMLLSYYQDHVIGGPGSFALEATGFASFGEAIDDKIIREIRGVPEPSTVLLLAIGLLALGFGMRATLPRSAAAA